MPAANSWAQTIPTRCARFPIAQRGESAQDEETKNHTNHTCHHQQRPHLPRIHPRRRLAKSELLEHHWRRQCVESPWMSRKRAVSFARCCAPHSWRLSWDAPPAVALPNTWGLVSCREKRSSASHNRHRRSHRPAQYPPYESIRPTPGPPTREHMRHAMLLIYCCA